MRKKHQEISCKRGKRAKSVNGEKVYESDTWLVKCLETHIHYCIHMVEISVRVTNVTSELLNSF